MLAYVNKLEASQNVLKHVSKTFPNLERAQKKLKNLKRNDSTRRDRTEFQKIIEKSILLDLVERDDRSNCALQSPLKSHQELQSSSELGEQNRHELNESWDRLHNLLLTN